MSTRTHFIIRGGAVAGSSCGLLLTLIGAPLWLIGINEWLGAGGLGLGLVSAAVVAIERRRG